MKGTVKFFKDDKGFGFITGEDGKDYFAHKKACIDTIRKNDRVTFSPSSTQKGLVAMNVQVDYNS